MRHRLLEQKTKVLFTRYQTFCCLYDTVLHIYIFLFSTCSFNKMSDEESSFVILGSTPTPSMEQYDGLENSTTNDVASSINANMMQSSTQTIKNYSLLQSSLNSPSLSAATNGDNSKNDSLVNSTIVKDFQLTPPVMQSSTASGGDFAEQFLMGEIPADSLKVSFVMALVINVICLEFLSLSLINKNNTYNRL